jgi:putative inorganic carbon (hco3(-)) transporter
MRPAAAKSRYRWQALSRNLDAFAADDRAMKLAVIAALAVYYLTPPPVLALVPLAAYAGLAWLRLDIALELLPLTFPFWYVPKHVTAHAVFPLSEVALAVCAGVAVAREAKRLDGAASLRRLALRLRGVGARMGWPLGVGVGLLVLGGTLGVLVARQPHEALRAYRWEIVEPLLFALLVLLYARGPRGLRRLLWAFLGSALMLAALAAAQVTLAHVTFTPLADGNRLVPLARDSDGVLRATAIIYGSGNSLGAYLERALPLALALALAPGRWAEAGWRGRTAAAAFCLAYLPALLWSGSRGAWAGAAVAVVVVAILALGRAWWLAALGALAGVVALWQRNGLVAAALAGHNRSGEERTLLWLAAWHMIRDHPLLGIGLDQFLYYYSSLFTTHPYWITVLNGHPTIAWREPALAHPHNLALDLWLSIGVLGLAGFAVVLGVGGWRILTLRRRLLTSRASAGFWASAARPNAERGRGEVSTRGTALRERGQSGLHLPPIAHGERECARARRVAWVGAVALGIGGSLLAGVVHGMVDSAYFVPDLALVFWWSVATLLVAQRCGRQVRAIRAEGG